MGGLFRLRRGAVDSLPLDLVPLKIGKHRVFKKNGEIMKTSLQLKKIHILGALIIGLLGSFSAPNIHGMNALVEFTGNNKGSIATAAVCGAAGYAYHTYAQSMRPLRFDWPSLNSVINTPQRFPQGFLFGSGTSAHQVEGDCTNNTWSLWEQAR